MHSLSPRLRVLVLRFRDLAPKGPAHEPATACDPTDLTDPTDRSDQLRWLAIPRALPWAESGIAASGRAKQRNTKTRERGTLAEVSARDTAGPLAGASGWYGHERGAVS